MVSSPGAQGTQGQNQGIQQGVRDLTGVLTTALNDAGVQNTGFIQPLGDLVLGVVGAIAASPAVPVATVGVVFSIGAAFVDLIASFFGSSSSLPQSMAAIQAALQKIQAELENTNYINYETNVNTQFSYAQTLTQTIQPWAQNPSAIYTDKMADALTDTENAVNALAPFLPPPPSPAGASGAASGSAVSLTANCPNLAANDSNWMQPPFQSYWQDPAQWVPYITFVGTTPKTFQGSYGTQAPSPDASGNVFTYTLALPAFLYALSAFITGAAITGPIEDYTTELLAPVSCLLQRLLLFIQNEGFVFLQPGGGQHWTTQTLASWLQISGWDDFWFGENSPTSAIVAGKVLSAGPQTGVSPVFLTEMAVVAGVQIEYGVVEKFSGYSSVGVYTMLAPPLSSDPAPFNKFSIRLLRRQKDVYSGTGLANLWAYINNLNKLIGQTPLPGPSFADWSFQRDVLPWASVQPNPNGGTSLRSVMEFIWNTPPLDFPESGQNSFRTLLSV